MRRSRHRPARGHVKGGVYDIEMETRSISCQGQPVEGGWPHKLPIRARNRGTERRARTTPRAIANHSHNGTYALVCTERRIWSVWHRSGDRGYVHWGPNWLGSPVVVRPLPPNS
jgi:hypothetical protein